MSDDREETGARPRADDAGSEVRKAVHAVEIGEGCPPASGPDTSSPRPIPSSRPVQCTTEQDRADLADARNGDDQAYARLIGRHQGAIGAYMWRFTRDRGTWQELVHDVFVEAYFSLQGYRGDAPFLHWLRKIATRAGFRHWKHAAREREHRILAQQEWPSRMRAGPSPEAGEQAELVHALLAEMAPRDRLVLTLLHLEELSTNEIADLTGWTHAMVRVQAFRARARLRTLVERHLGSGRP